MTWKWALNEEDLISILATFLMDLLDDLLFVAIVFTSFHALLQLGEMIQSDTVLKRMSRKLSLRHTGSYYFMLRKHNLDRGTRSQLLTTCTLPMIHCGQGCLLPFPPSALAPLKWKGTNLFLGGPMNEINPQ